MFVIRVCLSHISDQGLSKFQEYIDININERLRKLIISQDEK